MGALIVIVIWIIISIVFFVILYTVIQSAMDNTKMASNIQELRDHFVGLKQEDSLLSKDGPIVEVGSNEEGEDCPACGNKVTLNEFMCPVCELKLRD